MIYFWLVLVFILFSTACGAMKELITCLWNRESRKIWKFAVIVVVVSTCVNVLILNYAVFPILQGV